MSDLPDSTAAADRTKPGNTLALDLSPAVAATPAATTAPPPSPVKTRWHPLRSGLLNLYRYDDEEFVFEHGRLLIRGNNGTGKSRVLALQLPFLLDGETRPDRVEPDGDVAKRIEWNLLLGKYPDRLGYTWVEFGRRDDDGREHFLTLGCGLRAVEGRTGVDRWFFITPLRVRRDFVLQTDQRQPLTHERLNETLAGRGEIFREASRYRAAVDAALFGLGERYGALIELLLRLRQPQLARKLDEKLLSAALGEALTPLRGELLDAIADSFRSLDADRADLAAQQDIARAVEVFLADYRRYLRIAVRRRTAAVRSAHAAYEEAQRGLRGAERTREETTARRAALEDELARVQGERASAEGALKALQESPEMRGIQALQQAREETRQKEAALRQSETDLAGAGQRAATATDEENRLTAEAETAAGAAREAANAAEHAAQLAALADDHRAAAGPLLASPSSASGAVRTRVESLLRQRREGVAHLRALQREVSAAAQSHHTAQLRLHEREAASRAAEVAESETRAALAAAADALIERYRTWASGCSELRPINVADLAEAFPAWLERREGASPFEASLQSARTVAAERFAAVQAGFDTRQREHETDLASVRDEIHQLETGVHAPPLPPPLRTSDRAGRPGAPLWRVCDFQPDLPAAERAGLESALEAAGLLDAWILPDGTLLDPATHDTFLLERDTVAPAATLARWLAPALRDDDPDTHGLSNAAIGRALAGIGAGEQSGEHWVGLDGRWQLGPLTGRASKALAEHLGESTRAATRRRQLAELRVRETQLSASLAALAVERETLAARRAAADAEARAFPDHEPLRTAGAALGHALTALAQAAAAAEQARAAEDEARRAHDVVRQRRDTDAGDLGLLAWVDRLDALGEALHAYELTLARLWPALALWNKSDADAARTRELAARTRQEYETWQVRTRTAREAHEEARGRLGALLSTVGASEQELLEREAAQRAELQRLHDVVQQTESARLDTATTLARAAAEIERYTQERSERDAARQEHFVRLRHLVETGLAAEAEPTLGHDDFPDWSATRLVELARGLEEQLQDAPRDDATWAEVQSQIYHRVNALDDALVPHGLRPDTSALDDGLVVVRCPFQGRMCRPGEYAAALAEDLTHRERLLNQREREVIENHLLGDVAVELQTLLRRAEEWVDETNAELLARPTSTGMQLKFAWEADPEGPPGLESARRCLRRKNALWTPEDRAGLAAFLQQRIEAERTAAPDRSWRDHLGAALDYRKWHRFSVLRQQNDQWVRLTRRTYGTGSGGEKALALTIPQFAAAAAHYRSAAPHAPRLILLDEVFVGIDSDMRAKCVGLLATFDLDFVMTSEREWGCYPTLPGLAICQLTARAGVEAVLVTRWLWNGRELQETAT